MITITYAITTLVVLTAAYIVLKKALGAYLGNKAFRPHSGRGAGFA